jgi:hypothetical protein
MGRGSKRSGWLQTFLNCINTFIIPMKFPPDKAALVLLLDINSSYSCACLRLRGHMTICSNFPGNCFSTSFFNLLNRKGLMIVCNL